MDCQCTAKTCICVPSPSDKKKKLVKNVIKTKNTSDHALAAHSNEIKAEVPKNFSTRTPRICFEITCPLLCGFCSILK